ncbi:hypothetical protein LCGC14_1581400 [marine sediment metagenome]|uniref:Uncharacterized protein n=1 Tax=marine sediment metagenome TaxID=412755 RepID=A0A0F9LH09_9ZZZZ
MKPLVVTSNMLNEVDQLEDRRFVREIQQIAIRIAYRDHNIVFVHRDRLDHVGGIFDHGPITLFAFG